MDRIQGAGPVGPTTRPYWFGLVLIAAIGLVGTVIGALALAGVACGCTRPADLVVINRSATEAVIEWQHPGLLGTPLFRSSGRELAAACQTTGLAVDSGDVAATVSVGGRAQSVGVVVPDRGRPNAWIAIDSAGRVAVGTGEAPIDSPDGGADLCR